MNCPRCEDVPGGRGELCADCARIVAEGIQCATCARLFGTANARLADVRIPGILGDRWLCEYHAAHVYRILYDWEEA